MISGITPGWKKFAISSMLRPTKLLMSKGIAPEILWSPKKKEFGDLSTGL
jgi:hypothetical protein